ncbi:MAG: carboxypeptidase regulatory-like domain-containing protein, partial [Chloroflexia bacterium]
MQVLADAVAYARAKGVLVVAAAGNDGVDVPSYPPRCQVIGVAATDVNDARAGFSNFGSYVDVSAPGVSVISTLPDDQYGYFSGTSMSTPFVAGAAAVLKGPIPFVHGGPIVGRIRDGADDLGAKGYDRYTGYGRLNLFRALAISGTVYGVVRDSRNASALSNVKVSLQNSTSYVLTNGAGSYSFANLSHGSRSLVYSRWGYLSQSRTLSVQAGRSVRADVALTPLARVSGYVLDRAGRPLSGAIVRIAGTYRSDVTDSTGKYILTLVPTGSKSVVAGKSLYVSVARALTTRPGITHRLDFRLPKQGVL